MDAPLGTLPIEAAKPEPRSQPSEIKAPAPAVDPTPAPREIERGKGRVRFRFSARTLRYALAAAIGFLTLANLVGLVMAHQFDHKFVYGLVPLFDLNTELNIPSFFQSTTMGFAALAAWLAFSRDRNSDQQARAIYWLGLVFIFSFMALDETMSIHERFIIPFRRIFDTQGFLWYAWVIAYAPAALIIGALYWSFAANLPSPVGRELAIATVVYVSGAIGAEMIGGQYAFSVENGEQTFVYGLLYTLEELLEMVGFALFLVAICDYLRIRQTKLRVAFAE